MDQRLQQPDPEATDWAAKRKLAWAVMLTIVAEALLALWLSGAF